VDLELRVESDHLERLARANAITALSELVWNSLDAEATLVEITTTASELAGAEGIGSIKVADNGHGMNGDEIATGFGRLGGSWKANAARSKNNKVPLHGRAGQGRFKALGLGGAVEWRTVSQVDDDKREVRTLRIFRAEPQRCSVDEAAVVRDSTGTAVTINDVTQSAQRLADAQGTLAKLTGAFALRLMAAPGTQIVFQGTSLDPAAMQTHRSDYELHVPEAGDDPVTVTVIEWSSAVSGNVCALDDVE
jgi:hypothetical protein